MKVILTAAIIKVVTPATVVIKMTEEEGIKLMDALDPHRTSSRGLSTLTDFWKALHAQLGSPR